MENVDTSSIIQKDSLELYEELLDSSSQEINTYLKGVPTYHNFLTFNIFNKSCYEKMYLNNNQICSKHTFYENIPELKNECKLCWNFFLSPRNKSIKSLDVQMGKKFETAFGNYLKKKGFAFRKGDAKNKSYPDNAINDSHGNLLAYYEVKYHQAPFVKAFNFNPGRECYEGSITLDYTKVKKQLDLIEKEISVPVYFLHWVDFPCIKGIFYQTSRETKEILERGIDYNRKDRVGDFKNNKKIGYTKKFYPSLLFMKDFKSFLDDLYILRDGND